MLKKIIDAKIPKDVMQVQNIIKKYNWYKVYDITLKCIWLSPYKKFSCEMTIKYIFMDI